MYELASCRRTAETCPPIDVPMAKLRAAQRAVFHATTIRLRLTPQFSGGALTDAARRERIMK
jgi:hypothetical protein